MTLHSQTSHYYGHQMTILRTSTLTRVAFTDLLSRGRLMHHTMLLLSGCIWHNGTLSNLSQNLSCKLISEFAGWCDIWYLGGLPIGVFLDWMWCYILLSPLKGIWQGSFITIFSKQSASITRQGGWNNGFGSSNQIISRIVAVSLWGYS